MKRDYIILGVVALAAVLLPKAVHNPYYLTVFIVIGINTILVTGLNLLMGYAGQISLGHAAFYALGAYFSGVLTTTYHWNPWAAAAVALVATCLVALVIAIPTLKLEGHYLAMATLGIGVIVQKLIEEFENVTGGNNGMAGVPPLSIYGFSLDNDVRFYYFVWIITLFLIALSINVIHSRIGRACRAIHSSHLAANIMGVNVQSLKAQIFVLSAAYASVAGSVYAHYQKYLDPTVFGFEFSIQLVVMVVLGGLGSIWGGILGAAIINLLSEYITEFSVYGPVVYGLILIVMVLLIPNGIAGLFGSLQRLLFRKKEAEAA